MDASRCTVDLDGEAAGFQIIHSDQMFMFRFVVLIAYMGIKEAFGPSDRKISNPLKNPPRKISIKGNANLNSNSKNMATTRSTTRVQLCMLPTRKNQEVPCRSAKTKSQPGKADQKEEKFPSAGAQSMMEREEDIDDEEAARAPIDCR
jgi:hypothetical protein